MITLNKSKPPKEETLARQRGLRMEVRVIIGEDGEEYLNAKDVGIVLQKLIFKMSVPSLSTMNFVRRFIIEYITARRV